MFSHSKFKPINTEYLISFSRVCPTFDTFEFHTCSVFLADTFSPPSEIELTSHLYHKKYFTDTCQFCINLSFLHQTGCLSSHYFNQYILRHCNLLLAFQLLPQISCYYSPKSQVLCYQPNSMCYNCAITRQVMAHILHMGPVNQPRRSTELQEKAFKNGSRSQINEDLYLQKITLDVPEHFII